MDAFALLEYSACNRHPVKWYLNIETDNQYLQLRFISNKHTIAITEHSKTIVDQFYNDEIERYRCELTYLISNIRQQRWKSVYFKARVRQTNFDVSEFQNLTREFLHYLETESIHHGVQVEYEILIKD